MSGILEKAVIEMVASECQTTTQEVTLYSQLRKGLGIDDDKIQKILEKMQTLYSINLSDLDILDIYNVRDIVLCLRQKGVLESADFARDRAKDDMISPENVSKINRRQ